MITYLLKGLCWCICIANLCFGNWSWAIFWAWVALGIYFERGGEIA